MKRGGGRRYYRPEDLVLLRGVRELLYEDGYPIQGVQKLLREGGVRDYDFDALLSDYRISMCFIAYRLIAGGDMIDFSNERGTALIARWMQRLAALLPQEYRNLVNPGP